MYIDYDILTADENLHTLPARNGKATGKVVIFLEDVENMQKREKLSGAKAVVSLQTKNGKTYHINLGVFDIELEAERAAREFYKQYCDGFDFQAICTGFQLLDA